MLYLTDKLARAFRSSRNWQAKIPKTRAVQTFASDSDTRGNGQRPIQASEIS
jgi:hypothetical protein